MQIDLFLYFSIILLLLLIAVVLYYSFKVSRLYKRIEDARMEAQSQAQIQARQNFEAWVQQHSQQLSMQLEQSIRTEYEGKLKIWMEENEKNIRKDAISKSINTLLGKIGEEFAPIFLAEKLNVNPRDFRHLGSPVDYIAFKGLSDEEAQSEIIFIEVKMGKNFGISTRERRVRDAVQNQRVSYQVVNMNDMLSELKDKLNSEMQNI